MNFCGENWLQKQFVGRVGRQRERKQDNTGKTFRMLILYSIKTGSSSDVLLTFRASCDHILTDKKEKLFFRSEKVYLEENESFGCFFFLLNKRTLKASSQPAGRSVFVFQR